MMNLMVGCDTCELVDKKSVLHFRCWKECRMPRSQVYLSQETPVNSSLSNFTHDVIVRGIKLAFDS